MKVPCRAREVTMGKRAQQQQPRSDRSQKSKSKGEPIDFEIDISYKDFSRMAIDKALREHSFGHWSVRYSVVALLLSLLAIPLFGFTMNVFGALVATSGLALLGFIYNYYIKAESFLHNHVERLQEAIRRSTEFKMRKLKTDLQAYNVHQAAIQVEQIHDVFDNLVEILEHKFKTSELAYKRYYGIAQEVFLSAIDNLSEIVLSLKSIEHIDVHDLKARISRLDDNDPIERDQQKTLQRRLDLFDNAQEQIKRLLTENEKAMTLISETGIEISKIDVNDQAGQVDMENSMKQLSELIKHSQEYSS